MIIEGTIKEFRGLGTSYFTNLVKTKTRTAPAKKTLTCEGHDGVPHPVQRRGEIRFCHPPDRSRLDVLNQILDPKYRISGIGENAVYRCVLAQLGRDFWQEHVEMISNKTGKFLCRTCEALYR